MKKFFLKILLCLICASGLIPNAAFAGATGTISGFVSDQETGKPLPGAAATIEGTNFGAMADKHGFYIIYNVPVGEYALRVSMIGYVPMKLTNAVVKTDLNTKASFEMKSRVLEVVDEIVVTAPRVQILRDVLSSTQYFGNTTIEKMLPGFTYQDVVPAIPGFVANHFRGSRATSAQYLIDGLPASGGLTREMAFSVSKSAIAEMVVQTGGLSAEYGNVTSAVTNIITKEGRNNLGLTLKVASDIAASKDLRADHARRAEFALGGPLTFGFGGPMFDANYMIAGSTHLTNTPFHNELRQHFSSPLLFNYDLNTKVMMRVTKNIFVRWQGLFSKWDWRRYDPLWAERSSALPKRSNDNQRMSLSITHTVSPQMYYKAELSALHLRRRVNGELSATAARNLMLSADQTLPNLWPGAIEPWLEDSEERQWTTRLSLVRQLNPHHQISGGVQANLWSIAVDRNRYLLWPDGDNAGGGNVYSRYDDRYKRRPFNLAAYLYHKIELPEFLLTMGLRYEAFSPNTDPIPLVPRAEEMQNDSTSSILPTILHHTIAPRLGIAFPIGEVEHLSFNYGWFHELPSFYYLYFNANDERSAFWPLLGNPELQPIRARAWEITYRRALSDRIVLTITGFGRRYSNLIGTVSHLITTSPTPGISDKPMQVFRYENNVTASMNGLELAYQRQIGKTFTGSASYTYLESSGTASWPESEFISIGHAEPGTGYSLTKPLAWDQRHTFTLNLAYQHSKGYAVSLFSKLNGPATSSEWLSNKTIALGWRHFLDARIVAPFRSFGLKLEPFLEVRNLLDVRYSDPRTDGLDLSQPDLRFEEFYGRRVWVGFSFK